MHEHIDEFKLINMNGRVYDAVLGRFMQPDNQVQDPGFLQTFNKYAYVFNNSLSFTDPSGWAGKGGGGFGTESDGAVLGGLSAAYSNYTDYYAAHNSSGVPWASFSSGGGGGGGGWYTAGSSLNRYSQWMASSSESLLSGRMKFNIPYIQSLGRYTNHINWGRKSITLNFSNSESSDFGVYSFGQRGDNDNVATDPPNNGPKGFTIDFTGIRRFLQGNTKASGPTFTFYVGEYSFKGRSKWKNDPNRNWDNVNTPGGLSEQMINLRPNERLGIATTGSVTWSTNPSSLLGAISNVAVFRGPLSIAVSVPVPAGGFGPGQGYNVWVQKRTRKVISFNWLKINYVPGS